MQDENFPPIVPPTPPRPPETGLSSTAAAAPASQQLLGYDASGQPLYGTPASQRSQAPDLGSAFQQASDQQVPLRSLEAPRLVDMNPSVVRNKQISDDVKRRHEESVLDSPNLDLNSTEYIIANIPRSTIGLIVPLVGAFVLICLFIAGIISYPMVIADTHFDNAPNAGIVALVGIVLSAIVVGFTYMNVWIYRANRLYLTNERIIQDIQQSLFSHEVQTISLGNIEDVSYKQTGLMQEALGYGFIDLSTEGDQKAYQMTYVSDPRRQVATLTAAVEDFKNGRNVEAR